MTKSGVAACGELQDGCYPQPSSPTPANVVLLVGVLVVRLTLGLSGAAQEEDVASATPRAQATLTITSMYPLEVIGRAFEPSERAVVSTGARRKSVTANSAGRFVVTFAGLRCAGTRIVAVGSKGSRAATRPAKILCVAP
jgi:hypothetical protein